MELGLSAISGVASNTPPRVDAPTSQQAVKPTPRKSHRHGGRREQRDTTGHLQPRQDASASEHAARRNVDVNTEIDPDTRQVILQYIDHATKQLVRQVPDEELLRLQAYVRRSWRRPNPPATSRSNASRKSNAVATWLGVGT